MWEISALGTIERLVHVYKKKEKGRRLKARLLSYQTENAIYKKWPFKFVLLLLLESRFFLCKYQYHHHQFWKRKCIFQDQNHYIGSKTTNAITSFLHWFLLFKRRLFQCKPTKPAHKYNTLLAKILHFPYKQQ